MIHFGFMGVYVNLKPKLWICNFLTFQLWSYLIVWVVMWIWNHPCLQLIWHFNYDPFWCYGAYLNLKLTLGVYNFIHIPIMIHFGCMDVHMNLKFKLGVCNSINILIMMPFSCMGGYMNLKPCLGVCNLFGISIMIHFWCYEWLFELENYTRHL